MKYLSFPSHHPNTLLRKHISLVLFCFSRSYAPLKSFICTLRYTSSGARIYLSWFPDFLSAVLSCYGTLCSGVFLKGGGRCCY